MENMLSRETILQAQDIKIERVDVPEWGGYVYVKTMTGAERDTFEATQLLGGTPEEKFKDFRARMAALTICDEKGKLLFDLKDVQQLGEKSAAALERVFAKSTDLSRFTTQDVEDMVGN